MQPELYRSIEDGQGAIEGSRTPAVEGSRGSRRGVEVQSERYAARSRMVEELSKGPGVEGLRGRGVEVLRGRGVEEVEGSRD